MKCFLLFPGLLAAAFAQQVPGVYIVELEGDTVLQSVTKAQRRAVIQSMHDRMRPAFEQRGGRVTHSMHTLLNAMVVEIPDAEAAALRAMPGVRKVYPVFEVRAEMDAAPRLHKAVEAWTLGGGENRAGAGVKIGIVDSGIDIDHPAFQDSSLAAPEGFPKARRESDLVYTNGKVIVAKSFEDLLGARFPSARDVNGHGTSVAMVAAGASNKGTYGVITGMAPKAWLGSYKVLTGTDGRGRTDVIAAGLDEAVADGMDIISLSLGSTPAPHPELDLLYQAVERAAAAGLIVVKSAGNEGPDPGTLSAPGSAPSIITAGANWTDRILAPAGVKVSAEKLVGALPGNGPPPPEPMSGPLFDVSRLDPTGLACNTLPEGSLGGKVALIFRGTCFFEVKLNNAQAAGAMAAVIYTDDREISRMDVASAILPAVMVTNPDGLRFRKLLEDAPDLESTLFFDFVGIPIDPNEVVEFSSRGPGADGSIKPDMVAVGVRVSTALQRNDPNGELFSSDGYGVVDGTSYAAPMVAGGVAVVKSFRPGLRSRDYRSLLINGAAPIVRATLGPEPLHSEGSGMLNVLNAMKNTATAFPAALNFGAGGDAADISRDLEITNVGTAAQTYTLAAQPLGSEGPVPEMSEMTFTVDPASTKTIKMRWNQSGLTTGAYQGFVTINGEGAETQTRVPFWYAVKSSTPAYVTVFRAPAQAAPNASVTILVRLSDASGLPINDVDPEVTVATGEGSVVRVQSAHNMYPGTTQVVLRLAPFAGSNVFRIRAGEITESVSISGVSGL
ncbi:MAG: S8 family serine peptidase [Bryobacteraceae bacterium]